MVGSPALHSPNACPNRSALSLFKGIPMTIASEQVINGVTQERNLVSELPGPRSRGLLARKEDAVSSGVGLGPPVFVTKAGGGILVDANGNSLIDMGSVNATISQSE